jgi:hypothetical protein
MLSVERPTGALCKVLRFVIADHHYVAAIDRIREIVSGPPFPCRTRRRFSKGVIDLRGRVIPLIDLRERLGVPAGARACPTHTLIVGFGESVLGLIVDRVRDVLEVDSAGSRSRRQRRPAIGCAAGCVASGRSAGAGGSGCRAVGGRARGALGDRVMRYPSGGR